MEKHEGRVLGIARCAIEDFETVYFFLVEGGGEGVLCHGGEMNEEGGEKKE